MVSFNILGDCVSRDILEPLVSSGKAKVEQYVSFTNPISVCSSKGNVRVEPEMLNDCNGSFFLKRCMCLDINKQTFEYLFKKDSDYLILDIADARSNMIKCGDHYVTVLNMVSENRNRLNTDFGFDKYETVTPYDFDDEFWYDTIDSMCSKILEKYKPEQIIINEHYGVYTYIDEDIKSFPQSRIEEVKKYNILLKKLYSRLKQMLSGCYVIEFPDNVMANGKHKWGLFPLHYTDSFYEYGAASIEIITSGITREEKIGKLGALMENFERSKTDRSINVDNSEKIFKEWTGTPNTNDSPVKTHSNGSRIIVECDDKEQQAKQYIYHIYRYGKYLTSFKENSNCFEYETHGNEGVYKFLVEIVDQDDKKSLLGLSMIHIFSESTKAEFQKYLDAEIYDGEKSVKFFPLKYPFQDFLITLNVNKGKLASTENGFVIDMPAENVSVISKTGFADISDGKLILSGHFNEGERYIYGQEDVSSEDKLSDYMDKVGGYAFVGVNERGVICSTDYFGLCTLYCYRKDNRAYVSNRYQFLLRVLKAYGEELAISEKFIKRTMHTLNNYFSDYPVGDALVEGIETIQLGKQIRISNGELIFENSEIAEVFNAPKIDQADEYKKLLYMARDEIIGNAMNLLENKHFNSFSMDLTGGIDSRLTFAGVSRVKGSNKKVSIYSGFAKDNPEFLIACSLADAYGFNYDFRRSWFKNNRVGNYNESYREQIDLAASLSMNKLLDPAVFPRRRSLMVEGAMTIDGTAVEICTRNYALKFFAPERLNASYNSPDNQHLSYSIEKVLSQANITSESMLDTVNEQIQRIPGDSDMEKLDCYLLFYRSRNHFSMQRDGGYNQSRCACGLSKNAFKAYRLTYGKIGAYQMVFDLMHLINPVVAGYQYGEPKYDELKGLSSEKSLIVDNYSFIPYKKDISRFEQQQKEYVDEINRKQEFNDSVTKHFNSMNSNIQDKDVYLNNISYEDLHFVLNHCSQELRNSIGIDLFYFISEYLPSLEDKYLFSQKSKTFFIKIHDIASQIREIL